MAKALLLLLLSAVILTYLQTGVAHNSGGASSQISAAVHEILLPIMKEIKNDLNSMKNDLSSLNKTVSDLSGDLEDYKKHAASELAGLPSEVAGLTSEVAGLTSEVAGLQRNVTTKLTEIESIASDLPNSFQSNTQQLKQLSAKVDILNSKLDSVNASKREELRAMESQLEDYKQQRLSELAELQGNMTSELVGLQSSVTSELARLQHSVGTKLTGIENTTSNLHNSLQSNTQQLTQLSAKMGIINSNQDSFNANMSKELRAMESHLEENKQQTLSEIARLQSNVTSELAGLTSGLDGLQTSLQSRSNTHSEQLTQLCEKVNMLRYDTSSLKGGMSSLNDSMNRISENLDAHDNHVTTELIKFNQNPQNFTLQQMNHASINAQCNPVPLSSTPTHLTSSTSLLTSPTSPSPSSTSLSPSLTSLSPSPTSLPPPPLFSCGGTGGWRRVFYLDMTDPNATCPPNWQLTSHSKRTCGKVNVSSGLTCDSVTIPVSGGDYTRVCGRIIAYQYSSAEGFESYDDGEVATIDGAYVDGVSLTHGSPRQHIWTFAVGRSELFNVNDACPCDATIHIDVPPFVGGDYFCESGWNSDGDSSSDIFFVDDPLWDGDGCTANSTCCSFNSPPYFTKQLSSPTTDDIEARVCDDTEIYTAPVEFIELYVQ